MAKRKRGAQMVEEAVVRKRQGSESEVESSADEDALAFDGRQIDAQDRIRAYKGVSDEEIFSDESESVSSGSGEEKSSDEESVGSVDDQPADTKRQEREESSLDLDQSDEGDFEDKDLINERSNISFGALAKAQSQLSQTERSNHDRSSKSQGAHDDFEAEALERKAGKKDDRDFNRQSKHAPAEVSSKKAVSRKRSVVAVQKINVRDPRFDPIAGKPNENQIKKNYAFLSDYRDKEIAEMKAGIRKSKDPKAKATMEKALKSMESRRRTEQLEEQRQKVVRDFRKEERQKVKEGKKPYFLKSGEIKKRALEERLEKMKARDRTKAIERRRKKETAKERKQMPLARRME